MSLLDKLLSGPLGRPGLRRRSGVATQPTSSPGDGSAGRAVVGSTRSTAEPAGGNDVVGAPLRPSRMPSVTERLSLAGHLRRPLQRDGDRDELAHRPRSGTGPLPPAWAMRPTAPSEPSSAGLPALASAAGLWAPSGPTGVSPGPEHRPSAKAHPDAWSVDARSIAARSIDARPIRDLGPVIPAPMDHAAPAGRAALAAPPAPVAPPARAPSAPVAGSIAAPQAPRSPAAERDDAPSRATPARPARVEGLANARVSSPVDRVASHDGSAADPAPVRRQPEFPCQMPAQPTEPHEPGRDTRLASEPRDRPDADAGQRNALRASLARKPARSEPQRDLAMPGAETLTTSIGGQRERKADRRASAAANEARPASEPASRPRSPLETQAHRDSSTPDRPEKPSPTRSPGQSPAPRPAPRPTLAATPANQPAQPAPARKPAVEPRAPRVQVHIGSVRIIGRPASAPPARAAAPARRRGPRGHSVDPGRGFGRGNRGGW